MDIIFDVDGTLLNIEHRVPLIRPPEGSGIKKDWEQFRKMAYADTGHLDIIAVNRALYEAGHRILISTGRMCKEHLATVNVLQAFGVRWHEMYMRTTNDVRADHIVKLEMLAAMRNAGYDPVLAFDDRQQVVDMWRAAGLRCLQVAPGQF